MPTKIYKGVRWLKPFLQLANGLVPLKKVAIIKGYQVSYKCGTPVTEASCITHDDKNYVISLMTHSQNFKRNKDGTFSGKPHARRSIYLMLGDFAHELAHVVHWEHTPEHWELECLIQMRFTAHLIEMGVRRVNVRFKD